MKAIINKNTGKIICCSLIDIELQVNEIEIEVDTLFFNNPYYNFKTKKFYDGEIIEEETIVKEEPPQEIIEFIETLKLKYNL